MDGNTRVWLGGSRGKGLLLKSTQEKAPWSWGENDEPLGLHCSSAGLWLAGSFGDHALVLLSGQEALCDALALLELRQDDGDVSLCGGLLQQMQTDNTQILKTMWVLTAKNGPSLFHNLTFSSKRLGFSSMSSFTSRRRPLIQLRRQYHYIY